MRLAILCACALLSGSCLGGGIMPFKPADMTPEQLREWVKDRSANVGCMKATHPYGNITTLIVNLDKAVVSGSVSIDSDCKLTIQQQPTRRPDPNVP